MLWVYLGTCPLTIHLLMFCDRYSQGTRWRLLHSHMKFNSCTTLIWVLQGSSSSLLSIFVAETRKQILNLDSDSLEGKITEQYFCGNASYNMEAFELAEMFTFGKVTLFYLGENKRPKTCFDVMEYSMGQNRFTLVLNLLYRAVILRRNKSCKS